MAPQPDDSPEFLDEVHEAIWRFAQDHLEEDERDDFVDQLLERKGYQRRSVWAPPAAEPKDGGKRPLIKPGTGGGQRKSGGYFGGKRS